MERLPFGQASRQVPHPMHRPRNHCTSGPAETVSGFWHHRHESGQCLKKTVDRIPGPSSVESLWMLTMVPSVRTLGQPYAPVWDSRAMISSCSSRPTVVK